MATDVRLPSQVLLGRAPHYRVLQTPLTARTTALHLLPHQLKELPSLLLFHTRQHTLQIIFKSNLYLAVLTTHKAIVVFDIIWLLILRMDFIVHGHKLFVAAIFSLEK